MSNINYEILGRQIVNELEKKELVGAFDYSTLLDAASEVSKAGLKDYQDSQNAGKNQAATDAATSKAISADAGWAAAEASLTIAQAGGNSQQIASAQALESAAKMSSMQSGAGLPAAAQTARVTAAQNSAKQAAQASLSAPSDAAKSAQMKAWQLVAASVASPTGSVPGAPGAGPHGGHESGGNFLTKKVGGMPVYGWVLGGGVAVTGIVLLIKALRK